jgi:hypothetical protein
MNFERPFECFMGDNYNLLVQKNTFITPHLHIRSDAITYPTHALPLSALSSANFKELYNLELDFLFNLERDQEFPGVGDSYPEILYTVGLNVLTGNGNLFVLPVTERGLKVRVTREERRSFPVGTDRSVRRRPATFDRPVTPVPLCRAG